MCDAIMERRLREELAQSRGLAALRKSQLAKATDDVVNFVDLWHNACEDRDAARDLAARLEGMLARVEGLHDGPHAWSGSKATSPGAVPPTSVLTGPTSDRRCASPGTADEG